MRSKRWICPGLNMLRGNPTLVCQRVEQHLQFVKYCAINEDKTKWKHKIKQRLIGQTIRQQYERINQSILRRSTFSSLDEGTSPQTKMRAFCKVREIISYDRLYRSRVEVVLFLARSRESHVARLALASSTRSTSSNFNLKLIDKFVQSS